jgi:hypothetical protein
MVVLRETPKGLRYCNMMNAAFESAEHSGVRCYPVLSPLPLRMSELFGRSGSIDHMLAHVACDLVSIADNRKLVLHLERAGTREQFHLPGYVTRQDLESLMGKLDLTGIPMTVQQTQLAFLVTNMLVRNMTQPRLYRFNSFVTSTGGLDEDGLVMFIHESICRYANELTLTAGTHDKSPWECRGGLEAWGLPGKKPAFTCLFDTASHGTYVLMLQYAEGAPAVRLSVEYSGRTGMWRIRDAGRRLLWRRTGDAGAAGNVHRAWDALERFSLPELLGISDRSMDFGTL